jgi:hypothetical protein
MFEDGGVIYNVATIIGDRNAAAQVSLYDTRPLRLDVKVDPIGMISRPATQV